jgi:hypothetical protein
MPTWIYISHKFCKVKHFHRVPKMHHCTIMPFCPRNQTKRRKVGIGLLLLRNTKPPLV